MSDPDTPSPKGWGMTMRQRREALTVLLTLLDQECSTGRMWIADAHLLGICLAALAQADGQHYHRHHHRARRLRQDVFDAYGQAGYAQMKGLYFVDGLLDVTRQLQAESIAAYPFSAGFASRVEPAEG